MLWRNSPVYLYLFYVTGQHDPVVLRTKMSMLSVGLSIPRCVAVAIPKVQTVVSCRPCLNTFSRQKVHVIAEMAVR